MKTVLGFNRSEEKENRAACEGGRIRTNAPVKSLARIRFPEKGCSYTYYNDRFDLRKGDLVFVSGKLAGVPGFVEAVNYKFKIDLADYELVIACPEIRISGSYTPVLDKMVSCDPHAVRPDTFRSWVRPRSPMGKNRRNSSPERVTVLNWNTLPTMTTRILRSSGGRWIIAARASCGICRSGTGAGRRSWKARSGMR